MRILFPPRSAALLVAGLVSAGLTLTGLGGCGQPPSDMSGPSRSSAPAQTSGNARSDPTTSQPSAAASSSQGPAGGLDCAYPAAGKAAKPAQPPKSTGVPATGTAAFIVATTEGEVKITMDRAKAPCTVNSFDSLVAQHYFDGTRCHRLVDSGIFVLQCGDPSGTGSGGPGYTIPDEIDPAATYPAGTVAMANTGQPDSGGSQFFLVYEDSPLPADYVVFGQMDKTSTSVVARIAAEGQDGSFGKSGGGKPNNPAEISTVTKLS